MHNIGNYPLPLSELQRQHVQRRHGAIDDYSLLAPMNWSTLYGVYFSNLNPRDQIERVDKAESQILLQPGEYVRGE